MTRDLIGIAAAILTTVSFLPQIIRIHRTHHTTDLSLFMYIIFTIGVALWLLYGISIRSLPVIAANCVTLALAGYIIIMKIRYK